MMVTVVICTHDPRRDHLAATLASLRSQTPSCPEAPWELVIVDNASEPGVSSYVDLSWHPHGRIVREERLGLTFARSCGFENARGEIILCVDDDNVLQPDYVSTTIDIFARNERFGAIGGRSLPDYEVEPPAWLGETGLSLACRDLGSAPLTDEWADPADPDRIYPDCSPIGAGMAVRREAYERYALGVAQDRRKAALGRRGADLASGEDNDMIMSILEGGWQVAYRPELVLRHLIPAGRLTQNYLERYARSTNRTWIEVLDLHGICPWPPIAGWTLPLRRMRALMRIRPWRSPSARIQWQAALGHYDGRAAIAR